MSQDAGVLDLTFKAGADLTKKQYHFVKFDENGKLVVSTSKKSISIGILQNYPAEDKAARVRLLGTSKLVMAEACDPEGYFSGQDEGALITSDAEGKGAVAMETDFVGAIALEKAADPDTTDPLDIKYEVIEAIITHMYAPGGA